MLLVLIINTNTITLRQERVSDLRSEFMQQEMMNRLASEKLDQFQQEFFEVSHKIKYQQKSSAELAAEIQRVSSLIAEKSQGEKSKDQIISLQQELKMLENDVQNLAGQKASEREIGRQVRPFEGEGNRQYFTGLKLVSSSSVNLVYSSASMLDYKIVDIIRRKILDDSARRSAPKWRKSVSAVEWIIANLPAESSIQLYNFNTAATAITPGGTPTWIPVTDSTGVDTILSKLNGIAPIEGTNLYTVFLKARTIVPQPDNIILLTDGLPTQGKGKNKSRTIDGKGRAKLFEQAIKQLPAKVPVNILLFPIEGDPLASVLFWKLAIDSGGSFLTPTRDWP